MRLETGSNEIVFTLITDAKCSVIAIETDIDHIHLIFKAKPTITLSKLINTLKGVTARRLFKEFPLLRDKLYRDHLWSPSYLIVTEGSAPLEIIKKYVKTQREK